jgi:para-nitrobenzyl esterase
MTDSCPVVTTRSGAVWDVWRGPAPAFYGIPFAEAPVGVLRFAAPTPALPWSGERGAGCIRSRTTPKRRTFGGHPTG